MSNYYTFGYCPRCEKRKKFSALDRSDPRRYEYYCLECGLVVSEEDFDEDVEEKE